MTTAPSVDLRASTARGSTEYVQPIAILKTGSHWATIKAAAAASALAHLSDPDRAPEWDAWLAGPFAKSVRRADESALRKVREAGHHAEVHIGDAVAVATRPFAYADLPRPLARLQVAGTDLAREALPRVDEPLFTVLLSDSLDMTTGKSAAQAAHAVFLVVRDHLSAEQLEQWALEPWRFDVVPTSGAQMHAQEAKAAVAIRDAGHTEIEAGSLTALGIVSN